MSDTILCLLFGALAGAIFLTHYNTKEIHHHVHEIGCEVGVEHHCAYIRN